MSPQFGRAHVALVVLVSLVAGFAALPTAARQPEPDTPQPGVLPAQAAAAPCLPNDPFDLAGLRTIISSPTPPSAPQRVGVNLTVEPIGKGVISPETPSPPPEEAVPPTPNPDEPPSPPSEAVQFRVFNTSTQWEFRITMQTAMLDAIRSCHVSSGLDRAGVLLEGQPRPERSYAYLPMAMSSGAATNGAPAPETQLLPAGWSNADDTRILRTPTSTWPWRTISHFSNGEDAGCTGTLIGPRHLITAAHCINRQGTNTWYTFRVTPGKNGSGDGPYGNSVISPNPAPGDPERWYWTPEQWRDPALTSTQWDWGLIVIPDRLGELTSWMGYVARSSNVLDGIENYNRGYPRCGTNNGNAPAGCEIGRMYGDTAQCDIGDYFNQGSDGWNRRFSISCDLSAGHSGSPVYHYFYDPQIGKNWPVVTAVVIWETCYTCSEGDDYPNRARRITPGGLNVISWLRETFP